MFKNTEIPCPLCGGKYYHGHCTDASCKLSYVAPKEKIDWGRVAYKILHPDFKHWYHNVRRFFFDRYDIISTGIARHQYCDIVERMLNGMMGLVVEYIEKEQAFEIISGTEPTTEGGKPFKDLMIDLYVDWKVNYPKACTAAADQLTLWASGQTMRFDPPDEKGLSLLQWDYKVDKSIQDERFKKLGELDEVVYKMEQDMLHRVVDLRRYMWS